MPSLEALTYRVPDTLPDPVSGARVLVPLGTRIITGVVIGSEDSVSAPSPDVKEMIDILDETAFLPEDVLRLVQWTSEYYACGAGEALAAAMPPRAWIESERHAQITDAGRERLALERGLRAELLARLADRKPARVDTPATRNGIHSALTGLETDGLVAITRPLKGTASAFRTVRVATCTLSEAVPKGARQLEAIALLRAAPDGIDTAALATHGISAATL